VAVGVTVADLGGNVAFLMGRVAVEIGLAVGVEMG
jgi:hypothetical protein